MTSGFSGVFLHIFSSSDDRKMDEVTKQRVQLREMLEGATNHLKDCHFNQAKSNFVEARTYLKNCKKRDEMKLPDELEFYISVVICYSFTMELESIKDITKEDFKKEDQSMKNEIDGLVKKYPKRHFPLFLRLLYSFKKECWREAIYYCELVQNFKIFPEEENKYKSTPIFSKHLIPELDIDYCNEVVHNIEEAAIYGLVEKVAKLDELKNPKASLLGFNWVNLWSKDCNEKIIKRLRSYKKPMNSFQLHKLFHTEILPKFYTLNKSVGKSLFCYYKKEFMYQCEECLRAKLQQESRNELFGRLCEHSSDDNMSDDSEIYDTDDDNDDESDLYTPDSKDAATSPTLPEKIEKDKEPSCKGTADTKKVTDNEKVRNNKKTSKSQQTQTEKIKLGHRYVQTECSIKKKSIAVQTDGSKSKKQDKEKQDKEKQDELKCAKCIENTKLFSFVEQIKNLLSESKVEIKKSMQDQLNDLLIQIKQIREENYNAKNFNEKKLDTSYEIIQSKEIIAKLEKLILIMQETSDKERKDLSEKNVLLQKLLLDQISDKYLLYKNVYSGLENNCRVIIANVTELQNFLTVSSAPSAKDNQAYLNRWEKTLLDLQRKNAQLKSFYKKIKSQMLHFVDYECSDWPEIAEIPIEAFGFLFDSLKQNVKNVGALPKPVPKVINQVTPPPPQNQVNQMPSGQMYPMPAIPPNVRRYMGPGIRYGTYQQPPPPIPMPPSKHQNPQFPPWYQNNNQNAQMYAPNNQWHNNPNMLAFFKSFTNTADNTQNQTVPSNNSNFNQDVTSHNQNSASLGPNNLLDNVCSKDFWNVDDINSSLNKGNDTNSSENQNTASSLVELEKQPENVDMNDYFSSFSNFKTMSNSNISNFLNQSNQSNKTKNDDQMTTKERQRENLIQNGFWNLDPVEEGSKVINHAKDEKNHAAKHETGDSQKGFDNQESEDLSHNEASNTTSSLENLRDKIIHRPVRPLPKLVNVRKDEDSQHDTEKELFQYLKTKCSDVENDELMSSILKVLKKYNGSFSSVLKTDILKEVRSSILSTKHGVWISPKSPLVDWENDHADSHCSICFDDLNQRPKCVLPCKHEYHKDCISQWLRTNSVCPICRVHSVFDEDYPPLQ